MLCALWTFANPANSDGETLFVWPEKATLRKMLRTDRSNLNRSLIALEKLGVIGRRKVARGGREYDGFWLSTTAPSAQIADATTHADPLHETTPPSHPATPALYPATQPLQDTTDIKNVKNVNGTRREEELSPTLSAPSPLQLIPEEFVQYAPSAYERLAKALHEARKRAWAGAKKVQYRPLTSTRRDLVDALLREGYSVGDLERALRRKGEQAYREPRYRRRGGRTGCNRELVSIEHIARRERGTRALANLERLLANEGLEERASRPNVPTSRERPVREGAHLDTGAQDVGDVWGE